ncbi:PREDICTED: EF-hand calcium-binding domain-containing protein 12 [Elephantulus edwardii]|uniref:EF-hand calcium-binding domain-containing protein 12 n=1 Tax=Elephantulus edwardii TaxID=28737 RepID=UPI0003F09E6E|nr:PREDICTED: EF-hand calcium-binding domain-containing protein 12 [Elephantulus edwardii]
MDDSIDIYETLPGLCHSKTLVDNNHHSSKPQSFNPELVISHCFKQFKQENFHLPPSRRRIVVLPSREGQLSVNPKAEPLAPAQLVPSFKALEARDIQEQPLDIKTWLSQRVVFRKDLESFGNVEKWLRNKPDCTPSEVKVLQSSYKKSEETQPAIPQDAKKKASWTWRKSVSLHHLSRPPALAALYAYLHNHNIRILEFFNKVKHRNYRKLTREEFIRALNVVGVPLSIQEVEDIMLYLSSLGRCNTITLEVLDNTYNQWRATVPRRSPNAIKQYHHLARGSKSQSKKQKVTLPSEAPSLDVLAMPRTTSQKETQPMTLEEVEDADKWDQERRRLHTITISPSHYSEQCHLAHSGSKYFDANCLPSTIPGDVGELINKVHRDAYLVYLRCWKLCEWYGIPLTEDILIKALLYPGDRIILLKDSVCPLRQPGGYYSDLKLGVLNQSLLRPQGTSVAKKTKKKKKKKMKKMCFKEFEEFTRKLQSKGSSGHQPTHPNFFWPGHLLDKLRLYLPSVATDRSLAIFSQVQHQPPAYSATYHPDRWWPIWNNKYMIYGYHDACKVYSDS